MASLPVFKEDKFYPTGTIQVVEHWQKSTMVTKRCLFQEHEHLHHKSSKEEISHGKG